MIGIEGEGLDTVAYRKYGKAEDLDEFSLEVDKLSSNTRKDE